LSREHVVLVVVVETVISMAKSAYYPDVSYVASGDARRPFVDTIQAEATLGQDGSLLAMAEPALRHAVVQGIVEGVASYMIRGRRRPPPPQGVEAEFGRGRVFFEGEADFGRGRVPSRG
jgi:hypothetical protein